MFLLALLASIGTADAAGYYFTDAGTRGMSRAGAFIAGVNDLSAQYYNPAGLMKLGRSQAYVNHSMVTQNIRFARVDYAEDGTVLNEYDPVENLAKPMQIPQFAVGSHFGLDDFYFAFGLHPPFAPDLLYPTDGAQRYSLTDSLVLQFYLGPTVAWKPIEQISIGGGVYWSYVAADYGLSLLSCTSMDSPEDIYACEADPARYDIDVFLEMEDTRRFTWNAGIMIDPIDMVTIGFSVLPPINVQGRGGITADFGPACADDAEDCTEHIIRGFLADDSFADNDVTVKLTMPLILRQGVAVRPVDWLEIEAAAVYQRWSLTEEIRVTDLQLTLAADPDSPVLEDDIVITDDVVLPAGYADTWSWRLGTEARPVDFLSVRGGVYFEPTAIPPTTQAVSLVDGDKWGFGLGATYWHDDLFSVDVGYSRTQIGERDISNSDVRHVLLPLDFAAVMQGEEVGIAEGAVVGNGNFQTSSQYISAGLTFYWGKDQNDSEADG